MPRRPLAPCSHPAGCPELVSHGSRGRCPKHQRERERERGSAHRRGYNDPEWDAARAAALERDRYQCVACRKVGLIRAATDVDHIRRRRTFPLALQRSRHPGGADHLDNLQSLCHSHHSRKTRAEQNGRPA